MLSILSQNRLLSKKIHCVALGESYFPPQYPPEHPGLCRQDSINTFSLQAVRTSNKVGKQSQGQGGFSGQVADTKTVPGSLPLSTMGPSPSSANKGDDHSLSMGVVRLGAVSAGTSETCLDRW